MAGPISSAWAWSSTNCSSADVLSGRDARRADRANHELRAAPASPVSTMRIPKELERICLKALCEASRLSVTPTAKDMADDLRHFLPCNRPVQCFHAPASAPIIRAPIRLPRSGPPTDHARHRPTAGRSRSCPRDLRSFDAHDADFFLELLPGPRDRDGLPEAIRFWKTRIEEMDAENTFSIGLIYGPSGCGKSSLVKAGLLPRLADDRDHGLRRGHRKGHGIPPARRPAETLSRFLDDSLSLKDTLAALRRGQGIPPGKKVLIVLDQFEQWLHAKNGRARTPSWCKPCGSATAGECSASSWFGTISGWPSSVSCASWRSRLVEGQNSRAGRSVSTRPCPESAGRVRPGLRHTP